MRIQPLDELGRGPIVPLTQSEQKSSNTVQPKRWGLPLGLRQLGARGVKRLPGQFRSLGSKLIPGVVRRHKLGSALIAMLILAAASWSVRSLVSLDPEQRIALQQAAELRRLSDDISGVGSVLPLVDKHEERHKSYLAYNGAILDNCRALVALPGSGLSEELSADIHAKLEETAALCTDVVNVTQYSYDIFDSVGPYVTVPISPDSALPAGNQAQTVQWLQGLKTGAQASLINISNVRKKDQDLRYAGVPEIEKVLADNIERVEHLELLIMTGDIQSASASWRPTLALLHKNQQDILNHQHTYWQHLVRADDLQRAIATQNESYCQLAPKRGPCKQ